MKKLSLLVITLLFFGQLCAFNCPVTPADELPQYYQSIDGTSGKELLDSIQQVAKVGYRTDDFRYDSCWLAFKYTDMTADGYIWEIYSDCVFEYEKDRTSNTSQTGDCKGYNREHAMCQSWFSEYDLQGKKMSSSKKNSPGSDIFHIYPASYGMNSRRGNRPYGEVQNAANISGNGTKYGTPVTNIAIDNSVAGAYVEGKITLSTNVLEPADEYKGDIARSYFGTMVKWAGEWAFNKNELGNTIFDATIDADTHYGPENNYGLTNYGLAMLLKWHRQDPVSQKEVDRNNGIQKTQGNRNPFIDYPYLAEYIWGEMSGQLLDFDQLLCSADELFELGVSNGHKGEVVDRATDTIYWMVGDDVYDQSVVYHEGRLKQLPETPFSCSLESDIFVGWTNAPISGKSNDAPTVLYTKVADFHAINASAKYYAVFAEEANVETIGNTLVLNQTEQTDWTLSNNIINNNNQADGSYWLLVKDASITSPQIDLETLDSIAMTLRSYSSKKNMTIAVDGSTIGTVTATTNTMQRYVWNAPEMTGNKKLVFTGGDATAKQGVGVKDITLYLGGESATYINYLTHCNAGTATIINTEPMQNNAKKLIRDGHLYIQIAQQLFDSMGRVVE